MSGMDEDSFYQKEMERIERQQKNLRDQYNSLENSYSEEDYLRRIKAGSQLSYGLKQGETLEQFVARLDAYVKIAAEKNIKTHINGPKGAWFTHRNPMGCFCCEDMNMIHYLFTIIESFAKTSPKLRLLP